MLQPIDELLAKMCRKTLRIFAWIFWGGDRRGATLTDTIIGLALISIVGSLAAARIGDGIKQMRVEDAKESLNLIAMRLRDELANPDHLRTSADARIGGGLANPFFSNCVNPATWCVTTNPALSRPFQLFKVRRNPDGTTASGRISGTDRDPVFYNTKGEICKDPPPKDGCHFRAYSSFWATCALDNQNVPQDQCKPSQMVNFRFVVETMNENLPEFLGSLRGAKFPNEASTVDFTVRVPTFLIVQRGAVQSCGPGKFQDGYKPDGRPRCFCVGLRPTNGQSTDQRPEVEPDANCDAVSCKQDEILLGFDKFGMPQCKSIAECSRKVSSCAQFAAENSDCPCSCITTKAQVYQECPTGQWITGVNWGTCDAKDTGKKGADVPIECTGGFMLCCKTQR